MAPRTVEILVNPHAGAGRAASGDLERGVAKLRAAGWQVAVRTTAGPGDAVRLAGAAAGRGVAVVVAAGGDGTVNETVTGVLRVPGAVTEVAILPWGTGNDVAALLGVTDDASAWDAACNGVPEAWDVIEVRCAGPDGPVVRPALLFAACGFAGDLLRATTPRVKRWFGRHAYPVGFFRALAGFRPFEMEVRSPQFTAKGPWVVVLAANTPHAGGRVMRIGPGARWDDGLMDVSVIAAASRLEVARQFLRLVRGTHVRHPKVRYYPSDSLGIGAPAPHEVAVDGELIGVTPTSWRVLPGAIRMRRAPGRAPR